MTDYRDELVGWRLYFLHRGRLCSPMMRELQPVDRVEEAICLHEDHDTPAPECWCGWRVADNIAALAPAAASMGNPVGMLPVRAKLGTEHPETGETVWGWGMEVLLSWDWPTSALARVRAHGGVRPANDVAQRREAIRRAVARRGHSLVDEGPGMWRAGAVEVIGPVLTGQSPDRQFTPDPRDLADHYGVIHHQFSRPWETVVAGAAAGRIAPRLLGHHREATRTHATGQRSQPRRKSRAQRKVT